MDLRSDTRGMETVTDCVSTLACTETDWLITDRVEARHNGETVFARSRDRRIPRDCM